MVDIAVRHVAIFDMHHHVSEVKLTKRNHLLLLRPEETNSFVRTTVADDHLWWDRWGSNPRRSD